MYFRYLTPLVINLLNMQQDYFKQINIKTAFHIRQGHGLVISPSDDLPHHYVSPEARTCPLFAPQQHSDSAWFVRRL